MALRPSKDLIAEANITYYLGFLPFINHVIEQLLAHSEVLP